MKIGIDVGYGYVKAMNETGQKISFPALVAPAGNNSLGLGEMFQHSIEYHVNIQGANYLIGEAAKQSFLATKTLSREKPPEIHNPLLLLSAYLLSGDAPSHEIGVGLPLAYYASQKDELRERIASIEADVSIKGQKKNIRFSKVGVYPQGAGILLSYQSMLPINGYVGLIDIGTYTTEYLLFETRGGQPIPILEASGSVEAGVQMVYSSVAREFQSQTGSPLSLDMEASIAEKSFRGEPVTFNGKKYSLQDVAIRARENAALVITQKVLSAWGNKTGHIELTLLAGGGTLFFRQNLTGFPGQQIVPDPFFANAKWYLGVRN
ncbi:MAG: ParM/StbA family protein [Syntrophomonadaceae bacterium]|nr:ParM/StbA family protein [Syntrophomonadaceae bacterium]